MTQDKSFWIINISNRNVTLADLAITIKALTLVNLLDKRHHKYTYEQLIKSKMSGSIYKKKGFIKVRDAGPQIDKKSIKIDKESSMPSREKSVLVIKEEKYEELSTEDSMAAQEKYAEENAETAELDTIKR